MTTSTSVLTCGLVLSAAMCFADDAKPGKKPLVTISWKERSEQKKLDSGEFVPAKEGQPDALKFVNSEAQQKQFSLVSFEPPKMESRTYVVRGRIRYEGVEGDGYLEMWNHFASGGPYFTKTLAKAGGLLGVIHGTSDWREFALPFDKGNEPSPTKLEINLVLPGRGTVEVSDLALYAPADDVFGKLSLNGGWWSDQTAGLVGGIGGSLLGVFLGCIVSPLMATGKARKFVCFALSAIAAGGVVTSLVGIIALVLQQPYGVYYPLLLIGGMSVFFGIGGLLMARQRYRQHDMRRISALDVA